MTKAARKRHIANGGTGKCPYCKADLHDDAEYDDLSPVEDGDVEQTVECGRCLRRWIDVFRLVEVREIVSRE